MRRIIIAAAVALLSTSALGDPQFSSGQRLRRAYDLYLGVKWCNDAFPAYVNVGMPRATAVVRAIADRARQED